MNEKTGGPAFPRKNGLEWQDGMTLHQYYAGQALVGLLANSNNAVIKTTAEEAVELGETTSEETFARLAHAYADAMIAEGRK